MPKTAALAALIQAYKDEINWLVQKAGETVPKDEALAAEYLTRAEGLQGFVDAYERLTAQDHHDKPGDTHA